MAGKFFLFPFLSLLITTEIFAAPECNGKDENNCKTTAGCEWKPDLPSGSQCKNCDSGSYCEDGNPILCSSATGDTFPKSDTGAGSVDECYKTLTCDDNGTTVSNCKYYYGSYAYDQPIVYCSNSEYPSTPSSHLEGDKCYKNERLCSKFTPSGCNGTKSGSATYTGLGVMAPENLYWDLSSCSCTQSNTNYTEKNCIATKIFVPNSQQIPTVATGITYTLSTYYCTGCDGGYYVTPEDMVTQMKCDYSNSSTKVCSCTQVDQGYYISGCQWNYPLNGQPSNCVQPQGCPAGQTTNGPGATAPTDCHYTGDTKFCDAGGCFTLDEIQSTYSINPSEWTPAN